MPDFSWPQALVCCFALFCATIVVLASIGAGKPRSDKRTLPPGWKPQDPQN